MKKFVVTSVCLTGGIAASFKAYFPDQEVKAFSLPRNEVDRATVRAELSTASAWFTLGDFNLAEGYDIQVIKIPHFHFDAFHPDLTYATCMSTGKFTIQPYNSRIIVWCYANRIDPADACRLFNGQTFSALGYCDK